MPDSPPTSSSSSNDDLTRSGERYSEQEMALILKRAAELQEGADGRGAQRTMREIQEIAAEVGIDASFVTEAVSELRRPPVRVGWLGAPTRFHDERNVAGTLTPSAGSGERAPSLERSPSGRSSSEPRTTKGWTWERGVSERYPVRAAR